MKIGNFDLTGMKTLIIAELSANHGHSLDIAKQTIKAAKKAGADAIKLQTYTADTLTLNCDKEDFVVKGGTLWDNKTYYELYKEAYTPWEWHKELFEVAKEEGLLCFSTPFDKSAVDFLETLNPPAYKVASFEVTDYELVRYIASKQKPIIISTGIATLQEIEDVVALCKKEGNNDIVLLQCTSSYPAPLESANLLTIPDLSKRFGVIAGFSDHTLGITAPIAAVALGAKVIEKHFILDRAIGGADASFSLDEEAFTQMVQAVREAEKLLGKPTYNTNEKTIKGRQFSRSLYVAKDITKGDIFSEENIRSVRPGYGLHPKYLNEILGKCAKRDLSFGDRLNIEDAE
ncbi:pseudaminic acid synthase [Sulfurospirillum diekertiae]|uniref:Pseudaminic acid synthase n=1 Tax=Sulfurospirillum diekertiae TaxID=1854492 RepID=A0A1Y0HSA8_9BACT|nr:pseudaminic acid synthase [Sulfurospirillum diekertiae]ARU50043.1 Pseudaminic acid synthase [Sulfurospirillum diekertiae]ASC94831.1 Pseudaminic acid synthase [Sulfurospirillum diekertiae]